MTSEELSKIYNLHYGKLPDIDFIREDFARNQYEYYCSRCKEYGFVKLNVFMDRGYIHKHNSKNLNPVSLSLSCDKEAFGGNTVDSGEVE